MLNFGGYSNTKYDEYLKDTSDKRWKSLKKAEELLLEDAGVVPFLQVGNSKLLKSTMKNIETHSIGAKYDYKDETTRVTTLVVWLFSFRLVLYGYFL